MLPNKYREPAILISFSTRLLIPGTTRNAMIQQWHWELVSAHLEFLSQLDNSDAPVSVQGTSLCMIECAMNLQFLPWVADSCRLRPKPLIYNEPGTLDICPMYPDIQYHLWWMRGFLLETEWLSQYILLSKPMGVSNSFLQHTDSLPQISSQLAWSTSEASKLDMCVKAAHVCLGVYSEFPVNW